MSPTPFDPERVHVGGVLGDQDRLHGSEMEAGLVAQTPLGRAGRPDDIAGVGAFLASDEARWMAGGTIGQRRYSLTRSTYARACFHGEKHAQG